MPANHAGGGVDPSKSHSNNAPLRLHPRSARLLRICCDRHLLRQSSVRARSNAPKPSATLALSESPSFWTISSLHQPHPSALLLIYPPLMMRGWQSRPQFAPTEGKSNAATFLSLTNTLGPISAFLPTQTPAARPLQFRFKPQHLIRAQASEVSPMLP